MRNFFVYKYLEFNSTNEWYIIPAPHLSKGSMPIQGRVMEARCGMSMTRNYTKRYTST